MIEQLTIVGLGLLGGSVAKAARERGLVRRIVAVGRDTARLQTSRRDGVVDAVTTDLALATRDANFVLLSAPVTAIELLLPGVWQSTPTEAVITDVGSTKATIVGVADRLGLTRALGFVGSHPMAGSEQSGYRVSRADLFDGAAVIVTPSDRTLPSAVARVSEFWEKLGARVIRLPPTLHDQVVAAISHLPHLVAFALVDSVTRLNGEALDLAAGGFKDTTRIAASDPRVWREIFEANRAALAGTVGAFKAALAELEGLVLRGEGDALEQKLAQIKAVRERLA